MAKGNKSQLKQLKEELRDAGLRRGSKQCPATSSLQRDAQLHGIRSRFNPYGLKVTKQKHEIVGRSVRGVEGNPAISKQISEDHRRKALHAELAARKKTGGLIDRRFGEDDPNMTPEEKMLERFTKEKQKRARNTDIFNLENDQLTHYGQALEDFDNYDDINSDDDNVNIDQIMVERTHFGGFETDTRKKTRSEIMEEIMTKSKQHKYERQKEKEDDELEREALDDELRDIRSLLAQLPNPVETPRDKTDEKYDEALREMIFDKRAKPTERLKTEEEIAEEEAEKLKKLEEDRLQRMRGEQVVEAEVKRRGPAVADDLDDDFASSEDEDMAYAFGKGLESHIDKNEDEDSTNCIIESEYNENLADEDSTNSIINESEYNGNLADEDSSNSMINESEYNQDLADFEQGSASDNEMVTKTKSTKPAEIAFTFPCPATHKAFLNILEEIHIEDHATVVQRIRALYHPKLHADNKAKLAVFSQIILDHVMHLADNHLNPFPAIERLAKQVQSMLTQFGDSIAENIQIHLKDMQARCSKAVHFPRPSDLVLLTLISAIYPTSDFSHIIVTPAMLVMAQYLNQIKWSNVMSMVSAMYTSTLLLQYIRLSKRIVPEALNFHSLILARFSSFPSGVLPWIEENGKLGQKPEVPRKLAFKDAFPIGHAKSKEELEASILNESLGQVTTYAALYSGQEAFIELFQPYHKMLISALEKPDFQTLLSAELKSKALETSSTLTRMLNFAKDSRKPLTLQHHKAIPIASYLPKFDDKYSVDKRFDKDHADSAKLRAEYRRERKATIRELRSIGRTENNMKLVEQKDKDKAYEELMKKARSKVPNDQ